MYPHLHAQPGYVQHTSHTNANRYNFPDISVSLQQYPEPVIIALMFETIKNIYRRTCEDTEPSENNISSMLRCRNSYTVFFISKINAGILQSNIIVKMTLPISCTQIRMEVMLVSIYASFYASFYLGGKFRVETTVNEISHNEMIKLILIGAILVPMW